MNRVYKVSDLVRDQADGVAITDVGNFSLWCDRGQVTLQDPTSATLTVPFDGWVVAETGPTGIPLRPATGREVAAAALAEQTRKAGQAALESGRAGKLGTARAVNFVGRLSERVGHSLSHAALRLDERVSPPTPLAEGPAPVVMAGAALPGGGE